MAKPHRRNRPMAHSRAAYMRLLDALERTMNHITSRRFEQVREDRVLILTSLAGLLERFARASTTGPRPVRLWLGAGARRARLPGHGRRAA